MFWGHKTSGAIVCKYLSFTDPVLQVTFRLPLVHIRIKSGGKSLRTNALVDSGATSTFVQLELIEMLGLETKLEQETKVVGAGGPFKARVVKIDSIEVLKGTTKFCEFKNIEVLVPGLGTIPYSVLGRDSIFQRYDITYREQKEHIVFRRSKTKSRFAY